MSGDAKTVGPAGKREESADLVVRIKPARAHPPLSLDWLTSKVVVAAVLAAGAVFMGVMYLVLRDAGSFSRRKIEFPPLPQLNAAISSAQERLRQNPQDITTMVELGTLHFEKGKEFYPDAINELEEARDLGALDPRIFYCLGVMYQEVGLFSFSLEEYRRFLRHYPEDKEIRLLEAKLLYKQGNYPEAVKEFERLKFKFPSDTLVEENLGLSLWASKATDRARDSFNSLRAQGGALGARAEFYLGQMAAEKGNYQEALVHLQATAADERDPDLGLPLDQLHAALATAYQKLGQFDAAKTMWEQVVNETTGDAKKNAQKSLRDVMRRIPAPKSSKSPTRTKRH